MEKNVEVVNDNGIKYGYARVSTPDQNINTQIEMLVENGISRLNILEDKQSSYKSIELRKNLNFLLENVKSGDSITVIRLDRIARSTKELLEVIQMLQERGCYLKSITENIDTSGPLGMLYITILGAIKEFERELIKERSREGIERAKAEGKYKGRNKSFTDEKIKKIRMMINSGIPIADISRMFNCSRTTLYRYLKEYSIKK